jgi:DNA segregation ATPase FtsK/SpoIIIE, S-DNA-T family
MFKRNKITQNVFNVLLQNGFEDTMIYDIEKEHHLIRVNLKLPPNKELEDLKELLPNLTQELNALDYRITKYHGKSFELEFGNQNIDLIPFTETLIRKDSLKITLPSSFGTSTIDLLDGASCHMLNGGTTRMGKTVFLLYISTLIYIQTSGDVKIFIASSKIKDYYPFTNIPNVTRSETHAELHDTLDQLILEYKFRNRLLNSKELLKATDSKSILKHYPQKYYLFKPIFLIIDEYARFSDDKLIQQKVTELVETAGFVNIHVIISTQRPDARTVLNPRIKANLLCRICFTTTDRNNSILILDDEGAEDLGRIKGRAILFDGMKNIVQVPYLTHEKAYELLTPYRKEESHEQETTRPTNTEPPKDIQNLFTQSDSVFNLSEEFKPD